jgi:hypothetical protein
LIAEAVKGKVLNTRATPDNIHATIADFPALLEHATNNEE